MLFALSPIFGAKRLTIVALGDSTTAGTPHFRSPVEVPPDGEGDEEGQYAYWMMRKKPEWKVHNCGVAGERTEQIRARLEETVNRYRPRYVIILGGVNDIAHGYPLEAIGRNLEYMYEQCKLRGTIPIASTILPWDDATPQQAQAIGVLNRWIEKTADRLRIPFVDLNEVARDANDPKRLSGTPDGIHPDVGGHRAMGHRLVTAIEKLESSLPRH
jgi:lysophospholipase L1-like esterase